MLATNLLPTKVKFGENQYSTAESTFLDIGSFPP